MTEKDRFGTEGDGEPAFPRLSLKDAKDRPHNSPPSHVETRRIYSRHTGSAVRRPTDYVAPAAPGRGITMEQWKALRRHAESLRRESK